MVTMELQLLMLPCASHCWLLGAFAGTVAGLPEHPPFFIFDEGYKKILPHLWIFKVLRMKQGIQQCPENLENPPPPPVWTPLPTLRGLGSGTELKSPPWV